MLMKLTIGRKKGKRRKGLGSLDTGWSDKEAVVFDKKLGVKRNTTLGLSVTSKNIWFRKIF